MLREAGLTANTNKAKRQSISPIIFQFLCKAALDTNGCGILRFVVNDAVYFSSQRGHLMWDDSCAVIPPLLLEY